MNNKKEIKVVDAAPQAGAGKVEVPITIKGTDEARKFVDAWHLKHFPTDRTFTRYIMNDPARQNPLAGDFAYQLANALAAVDATSPPAPVAEEGQRPTDDHLWDETIRDRDQYHEWADRLAEAISKHFDAYIGEHSNTNCPWSEALEAIESASQTTGEGQQQDERAAFEAWHRSKFETKHCTGQPTRDMHNGVYAENYGPEKQQLMWEAWQARASLSSPAERQEAEAVNLESIEQYNLQMAAIAGAAIGYWTESTGIKPEYDTVPLRDVAKLYAKYEALRARLAAPSSPSGELTNARIIEIADRTKTAESRDGDYILPISFARAIEREVCTRFTAPSGEIGTVDTPEFRELLGWVIKQVGEPQQSFHRRNLIAHIDQNTAQAVKAARDEAQQWISVDERLSERACLASYTPHMRGYKPRVIRAVYFKQYQIEATGEEGEDTEYNEADDTEYIKAGWYECIDNWGDFASVAVCEGVVTHWMPLPPAPQPSVEQGGK